MGLFYKYRQIVWIVKKSEDIKVNLYILNIHKDFPNTRFYNHIQYPL